MAIPLVAADPVTPGADALDAVVARFLDAVWMERGLSANTLAAYRADLVALSRYLARSGVRIEAAARSDVLAFVAWRSESGAQPRSTARQLSSFRRFYRYMTREGLRHDDPRLGIEWPLPVSVISPKDAAWPLLASGDPGLF